MVVLKAWLALAQFILKNFLAVITELSDKEAFQKLKAFDHIAALKLPLSGYVIIYFHE